MGFGDRRREGCLVHRDRLALIMGLEFQWKATRKPVSARSLRIIGFSLLGMSLVFLSIALINVGITANLRSHAVHVTATVDALVEVHGSQEQTTEPSVTYAPEFLSLQKMEDGIPSHPISPASPRLLRLGIRSR
jgi:hypothetical protein